MIKITKEGKFITDRITKGYKVTCKICECEFTIEKEDFRKRIGKFIEKEWNCPCCGVVHSTEYSQNCKYEGIYEYVKIPIHHDEI